MYSNLGKMSAKANQVSDLTINSVGRLALCMAIHAQWHLHVSFMFYII